MSSNSNQMSKTIWAKKKKREEKLNQNEENGGESMKNLNHEEEKDLLPLCKKRDKPKPNYKELTPIVWRNVFIIGLLHLGFLHGAIMAFFCDFRTILLGNYIFYRQKNKKQTILSIEIPYFSC